MQRKKILSKIPIPVTTKETYTGEVKLKNQGYQYITIEGNRYVLKVEKGQANITSAVNFTVRPRVIFINNKLNNSVTDPWSIVVECKKPIIPISFSQSATQNTGGINFLTRYNFYTTMVRPAVGFNSIIQTVKYPEKISPYVQIINDNFITSAPALPVNQGLISWTGCTNAIDYNNLILSDTDFVGVTEYTNGYEFQPSWNMAQYCTGFISTANNDLNLSMQIGFEMSSGGAWVFTSSVMYFEQI